MEKEETEKLKTFLYFLTCKWDFLSHGVCVAFFLFSRAKITTTRDSPVFCFVQYPAERGGQQNTVSHQSTGREAVFMRLKESASGVAPYAL